MKTRLESKMEFKTIVHRSGGSGHIIVPSSMVGKEVKVTIEIV